MSVDRLKQLQSSHLKNKNAHLQITCVMIANNIETMLQGTENVYCVRLFDYLEINLY